MTFIIKQTEIDMAASSAPPWIRDMLQNFSVSVAQHAKDLSDHYAHMQHVERQKNLPIEQKTHQVYPPPSAPTLIDQAVLGDGNGGFIPDYKLINDRPSTEQLVARRLREKKEQLSGSVLEQEVALIHVISGGGKSRAYQLRYMDIAAKDAAIGVGLSLTGISETKEAVEVRRSPEDTKFKQEHEARSAKIETIVRHGAELHAQIEDLTPQNIDSWTMAPFPGV